MTENNLPTLRAIREWLETQGYAVSFKVATWTECLIGQGDERWFGKGADETDALVDALRQMFPSKASRLLLPDEFKNVFKYQPPNEESPIVPWDTQVTSFRGVIGNGQKERGRETETDESDAETGDEDQPPQETTSEETSPDGPPAEPNPPIPLLQPTQNEVKPDTTPSPVYVEPPRLKISEALQELEPLADRILSETPELGLSTPERQRLVLLAWISQARAVAEAAGHAQPVSERVGEIARYITGLSKRWWPGMVQALQLETEPGDLMEELELESRPETWEEVAEVANEWLEQLYFDDAEDGRDEYGWIDDEISLNPAPLDPESDLRTVRGKVEQLTGSIDDYPPKEVPEAILHPSQEDLDAFVEWGRIVRWCRGSVVDFESWSNLIGRLRWIATQLPKHPQKMRALETELSSDYRPPSTWAKLIGRDPDAKKKKREIKQLYEQLPPLLRSGDTGEIVVWMQAALPLLDPQSLAQAVEPVKDTLLALQIDDVTTNRGERRRFRQVLSLLQGEAETADREAEAEPETTLESDEDEAVQDASEQLLELVRPFTEDKTAIFVSNRNDPELESMLKEGLCLADVIWCEGGPRTVQSVTEKISDGRCDFVLAATGFQSHAVDGKLYSACKRASIPYIRVNKGRLIASARAIAVSLHLLGGYSTVTVA